MTVERERPRDRWWFWLAVGFAPIVLIVVEVLVANRRDHIGTVDGLARLDDAPCDDGAACAGWAVSLDDEGVAVNCRSVDESLLGEQFAQGPGGRGFRLAGFDTDVVRALTDSMVCGGDSVNRHPGPVLAGSCAADESATLDDC